MSEIFKRKEFIGEFFTDDYEKRFVGKVVYSPENGVIFEYSISGTETPNKASVLYGVLDNGNKCTLLGAFNPQGSGIRLQNGMTTRHGKVGFPCLLIGECVEENALFEVVTFTLTNMQEFFFPKGYKDFVKYSSKPLVEIELPYGVLEIGTSASFGLLNKDITSQIYCKNEATLAELKCVFDQFQERHPEENLMLKQDIKYVAKLKMSQGQTINDLHQSISDIANLFAMLTYNPVYPDSINVIAPEEGQNHRSFKLYPSIVLEKRTMDLALRERSNFHLPITKSNIDLSKTIEKWVKTSSNFQTIISSIQNETGFRDEHSIHGEIVVYSTQLESISYNENKPKSEKYEYPIDKYGKKHIKPKLIEIFKNVNNDTLGENISGLRNEIAHVGRPKTLTKRLSMQQMVKIGQLLQMVVIGYIFDCLNLEQNVTDNYQDKFTKY